MVPRLEDCITELHRWPGGALQDGICSHFPQARTKDLEEWTKVMSEKILLATELYRASVDSLLKEMNKGDGFVKDGKTCKRAKFQEPKTC